MADGTSASFPDVILSVEFVAGSGTYSKVCGIKTRDINRSASVSTTEIPDCDDDSKPMSTVRDVQSLDFTIGGTGVWAAESHGKLLDWLYSGEDRNVKVQHVKAQAGDTEYEEGPAKLEQLNNAVERGAGRMSADIQIGFNGTPTRTAKGA